MVQSQSHDNDVNLCGLKNKLQSVACLEYNVDRNNNYGVKASRMVRWRIKPQCKNINLSSVSQVCGANYFVVKFRDVNSWKGWMDVCHSVVVTAELITTTLGGGGCTRLHHHEVFDTSPYLMNVYLDKLWLKLAVFLTPNVCVSTPTISCVKLKTWKVTSVCVLYLMVKFKLL